MTTPVDISPEAVERLRNFLERRSASVLEVNAAAALEALRSALTDAQEVARRGDEIILRLDQKLAAAHSSLTASEKDAARYRWLRDQYRCMSPKMDGNHHWSPKMAAILRGPSVDAAIDAAMEKANG